MTPEERNLINELFDRIATLENAQRDPAAEQAIYDGFQRAPNAAYALVQTVLVQDEVLKRAEARIRELEAGAAPDAPRDSSFLGSMRETLGFGEPRRAGSVPSVKPGMSTAWRNTGTPGMQSQGEPMPASGPMTAPMNSPTMASGGMGGSFLGTAAAAAAGVVGGSLLMGGLRSMMGGGGQAHSAFDPSAGGSRGGNSSPWSGSSEGGGDLSRQAGLEDMGRGSGSRGGDDSTRAGLFDTASRDPVADGNAGDYDSDAAAFTDDGGDYGGDVGGDGGGGE
jgi:hypothetical protein